MKKETINIVRKQATAKDNCNLLLTNGQYLWLIDGDW